MIRTSKLERYGVVIGRYLFKYERPKPTKRGEKYREPKPAGRERHVNKAAAESARKIWEGILV